MAMQPIPPQQAQQQRLDRNKAMADVQQTLARRKPLPPSQQQIQQKLQELRADRDKKMAAAQQVVAQRKQASAGQPMPQVQPRQQPAPPMQQEPPMHQVQPWQQPAPPMQQARQAFLQPGMGGGQQLSPAQMQHMQQRQQSPMQPMQGGPQNMPPEIAKAHGALQIMNRQAEINQQQALGQIPAYGQMQALQNQFRGRQPTPQEMQQMDTYGQQIQGDPRMQALQQQQQKMSQQFQQQYGGQLENYGQFQRQRQQQQQPKPPDMGRGQQPMPGPNTPMDMMYRPGSMPEASPQQRQQREMEMGRAQQMAMNPMTTGYPGQQGNNQQQQQLGQPMPYGSMTAEQQAPYNAAKLARATALGQPLPGMGQQGGMGGQQPMQNPFQQSPQPMQGFGGQQAQFGQAPQPLQGFGGQQPMQNPFQQSPPPPMQGGMGGGFGGQQGSGFGGQQGGSGPKPNQGFGGQQATNPFA